MEKEKRNKKGKFLKKAIVLTGFGLLTGWAMKERSRADRLEGENQNLRQQLKGAQRTINILNYNLGKERFEK